VLDNRAGSFYGPARRMQLAAIACCCDPHSVKRTETDQAGSGERRSADFLGKSTGRHPADTAHAGVQNRKGRLHIFAVPVGDAICFG
jgi:hypothetical protein